MPDKIYSIALSDGTVLENLKMNGDNYISKTEILHKVFEGNLSSVTINDGIQDEHYTNMELVRLYEYENEWWFVLREITSGEMAINKIRSDIEYIAMMSDIVL